MQQKSQDYFRELVTIFFIRKNIILAIALGATLIAVLIAFLAPPVYQARSAVLLKSNQALRAPDTIDMGKPEIPRINEADLFSEMEIFNSSDLIERAIRALAKENKVFTAADVSGEVLRRNINRVLSQIKTEISPRSNVFNVSLNWDRAQEAETLLGALMTQYLQFRSNLHNPMEATLFFKEQFEEFDQELRKVEGSLIAQAEESKVASPLQLIEANVSTVKNLSQTLQTHQFKILEQERYVDYLERSLSEPGYHYFIGVDNPIVVDFGKRIQDLVFKRNKNLEIYTPESEKIRRLDALIDTIYADFKDEVRKYIEDQRAKLTSLKDSSASMQQRIESLSEQNLGLYRAGIETNSLERRRKLLEESLETFAKRYEESRINNKANTDKLFIVSILSKPYASKDPVFPDKAKVIALGLLAGIVAGIAVGFLQEFLDHSFKRPEDVENACQVPTIFSIPAL